MPEEEFEGVGNEQLSDDDVIKKIAEAMQGNAPSPEEKQNVFTFLHAVATSDDTTKLGYLRDDKEINEVGIPRMPVRSYHSMALVASDIMGNKYFEDYFKKEAEIITATSLSRTGFLTKLAVLQKREIKDTTPKPKKKNTGWFRKKESESPEEE